MKITVEKVCQFVCPGRCIPCCITDQACLQNNNFRLHRFYIPWLNSFVLCQSKETNSNGIMSSSQYSKIAAITCFIATIGDFAITFLIGFLYKSYNFLTDSESNLGNDKSPVAIYMNTWTVLFGLLLITCAWCLFRTDFAKTKLHKLAIWLLIIYSMGEGIGSGLFPYNHVDGQLTTLGWLHSIFSGIGITAMVILSFVLIKLFSKKIFPGLNIAFWFFATTGAVFMLFCVLSRGNFLSDVGLWQRIYVLNYYGMLITLTMHVYHVNNENDAI